MSGRYRCGRCRRIIPGDFAEDHANNAHGVEPVKIDFIPVPDSGKHRPLRTENEQ